MIDLKEKTKEYLKNNGFYFVDTAEMGFPSLIAWQSFLSEEGLPMELISSYKSNPTKFKSIPAFCILGIELVEDEFPEDKRKKAEDLLKNKVISSFILISSDKKGKLNVQELFEKDKIGGIKKIEQINARYIG